MILLVSPLSASITQLAVREALSKAKQCVGMRKSQKIVFGQTKKNTVKGEIFDLAEGETPFSYTMPLGSIEIISVTLLDNPDWFMIGTETSTLAIYQMGTPDPVITHTHQWTGETNG